MPSWCHTRRVFRAAIRVGTRRSGPRPVVRPGPRAVVTHPELSGDKEMKIKSLIIAAVCAMFLVSVTGVSVFAQGAAAPAPAAPAEKEKPMKKKAKKAPMKKKMKKEKAEAAPAAPAAPAK